jgi:hypothetical protein
VTLLADGCSSLSNLMVAANAAGPDAALLTPPASVTAGEIAQRVTVGEWAVDPHGREARLLERAPVRRRAGAVQVNLVSDAA